jgi:uncharacterized protein
MTIQTESKALTRTLSRFAVEGATKGHRSDRVPSTAGRERARVRVRSDPVGTLVPLALLAALAFSTTVRAQESDPAAVAKAKEVMAAAHSDKMADQVITMMEKPLSQLIESANPGRAKEVTDLLHDQFIPAMRERLPEFTDMAARVYAKHFTVEDLDQLIAFYDSPIGKKLVAEQGAMLAEMGQLGQAWGRNVATEVMRKLAPEFQKRGLAMPNI